jgi:hypothetical protein
MRHPDALYQTSFASPYESAENWKKYSPYSMHKSRNWEADHLGKFVECDNPWKEHNVSDDVMVFVGTSENFPKPSFGSSDAVDWDSNLCFERRGRWEAYGFAEPGTVGQLEIDWNKVNWGNLQDNCLLKNHDRFNLNESETEVSSHASGWLSLLDHARGWIPGERSITKRKEAQEAPVKQRKTALPRTAILIRVNADHKWTEGDKQNIRSIIKELALDTGSEFQVVLMVQIGKADERIWSHRGFYNEVLQKSVPKEFQCMAQLWNEHILRVRYINLPKDIKAEQAEWLPLQHFAHMHPTFDYFWNWAMNSRFTGHHYDLVTSLPRFARLQPRKAIWERSERMYIPTLHGPYESTWRYKVEGQLGKEIIWAAPVVPEFEQAGPRPPPKLAVNENYLWGVGEDADYLSLSPIFNPVNTTWPQRNDIYGYKMDQGLPRRASLTTHSMVSKRLLDLMHQESLQGRHLGNQMAAPTIALLHGLKSVYAPHPMWFDRPWNDTSLHKYFNAGAKQELGRSKASPYSANRVEWWKGSTWDPRAQLPTRLWKRWMGKGILGEEGEGGGPEVCRLFLHRFCYFADLHIFLACVVLFVTNINDSSGRNCTVVHACRLCFYIL